MKRSGTPAAFILTGGISRHAFVERREAARAEMCACGHRRGDHQDDCAGCRRFCECGCLSFDLDRRAS